MAINYWAILVAALGSFVIGALWYSPLLFGNAWRAANGYSDERMSGMKGRMVPGMVTSMATYLVVGYIVSRVLGWSGRGGALGGLEIALMLWFGFLFLDGLASHFYSDRKPVNLAIDSGYRLAFMVLIGLVVGGWR